MASLFGFDLGDTGVGDIISGITGIAGIAGDLYKNNQNLQQVSNQSAAEFEYNKGRDLIKDQQFEENLANSRMLAGISAGAAKAQAAATVAAANIAAQQQQKRTLNDAYNNYMTSIGQIRKDKLAGYANLGASAANPWIGKAG